MCRFPVISVILAFYTNCFVYFSLSLRNYPQFVISLLITYLIPVDIHFIAEKNDAFICFISTLNYRQSIFIIYITIVAEISQNPCYLTHFVVYYYCMFLCICGDFSIKTLFLTCYAVLNIKRWFCYSHERADNQKLGQYNEAVGNTV